MTSSTGSYQEFLARKKVYSPDVVITVDASEINPSLKAWQSDSVAGDANGPVIFGTTTCGLVCVVLAASWFPK